MFFAHHVRDNLKNSVAVWDQKQGTGIKKIPYSFKSLKYSLRDIFAVRIVDTHGHMPVELCFIIRFNNIYSYFRILRDHHRTIYAFFCKNNVTAFFSLFFKACLFKDA